jgi:hypothetical protein
LSSESASTSITDNRVIDRSLVQGPAGDRATDDQIMTGNFQIVATVKGEKWWMALDMEPADVLLTGA